MSGNCYKLAESKNFLYNSTVIIEHGTLEKPQPTAAVIFLKTCQLFIAMLNSWYVTWQRSVKNLIVFRPSKLLLMVKLKLLESRSIRKFGWNMGFSWRLILPLKRSFSHQRIFTIWKSLAILKWRNFSTHIGLFWRRWNPQQVWEIRNFQFISDFKADSYWATTRRWESKIKSLFLAKPLGRCLKFSKQPQIFSNVSRRPYVTLKFHAKSVFFWAHELMVSCACVKNQFFSLLNRAHQIGSRSKLD